MGWVPTFAFLKAVMQSLMEGPASAGWTAVLEAVYIGLGIAPTPAPSNAMLMSDITECNYTGYARQPVVWYPTYRTSTGPQVLEGHSLRFQPTDAVTPNQGTVVFVASALTAGTLYLAQALNPVINLSDADHGATVDPWFQMSFTAGTYGAPDITT